MRLSVKVTVFEKNGDSSQFSENVSKLVIFWPSFMHLSVVVIVINFQKLTYIEVNYVRVRLSRNI